MKNRQNIEEIRAVINEIDSNILALLHQRFAHAQKIGKIKKEENKEREDILREQEIFERLLTENRDFFPRNSLLSIFREIINTCKHVQ